MNKRSLLITLIVLFSLGLAGLFISAAGAAVPGAPDPLRLAGPPPVQAGPAPAFTGDASRGPAAVWPAGSAPTRPLSPAPAASNRLRSLALSAARAAARAKALLSGVLADPPAAASAPGASQTGLAHASAPADPTGGTALAPGFTVHLNQQVVIGSISPCAVVTITSSSGSYGAAEADAAGFLWTNLWQPDGSPGSLSPGDVLSIYVDGVLATTLTPLAVSGGLDVLADQVSGVIDGASAGVPVTITIGTWGSAPQQGAPQHSTTTIADGSFFVPFSGVDLNAISLAQIDYVTAGGVVRAYLFPYTRLFASQNFDTIAGYAPPGTPITATVYLTYPSDIRWRGAGIAAGPAGFYTLAGALIEPGDLIELTYSDGFTVTSTAADLHDVDFDAAVNRVSGFAPDGAAVTIALWQQQDGAVQYFEAPATAGGGFFDAILPADLQPRDWVQVFHSDASGNHTQIFGGPPFIDALLEPYSEYDCLWGRVDAPGLPITISIQTGSGVYTRTRTAPLSTAGNSIGGPGPYGYCLLIWGNDWGPIDFAPGDVVTLQSPSWSDSLEVPDLSRVVDTVGDQVSGIAPAGEVEVTVSQWNGWAYPAGAAATRLVPASGTYYAAFTDFDLRAGGSVLVRHSAVANGFVAEYGNNGTAIPYLEALPPAAVQGLAAAPGEVVTASLYDESGTWLAATSSDKDDDPLRFWFDEFGSYPLEAGYWVTVTSAGGWTEGLQIPSVTVSADLDTDLVWGQAPKSSLFINTWRDAANAAAFVPVDGYVFDSSAFGFDLNLGDFVDVTYQATSGNRALFSQRLGEVFHVEFWLDPYSSNSMWGEAQPGEPVTVTTPYTQVLADADPGCPGCWVVNPGLLLPGDAVTVTAGAAAFPVVSQIPDPLDVTADSSLDQVFGQIGGWYSRTVEIHGYWPDGYREVTTDGAGTFIASYADLGRGGQGYIRFVSDIPGASVIFHRYFLAPDLLISVNSGHDWVEGNYEPGHTVWISATDSTGLAKGYATLESGQVPWWGGQTGFSTNWQGWLSGQPDLQPGDWVYVAADNGYTTQARIGLIEGLLDIDQDTVSGAITAAWFTETLYARCSVWAQGGPSFDFTVDPAGDDYFCDFSAVWDLIPGENVAVSYDEPDHDTVINVFQAPAPNLSISNWAQAWPAEGSNFALTIQYSNYGQAPAPAAFISASLAGLTYLSDTSGLPHSGSGAPGDPLIWAVGDLPNSQLNRQFDVFVQVDVSAGAEVSSFVAIDTPLAYVQGDPGSKQSFWSSLVQPNDAYLSVRVDTWTWDPAPGSKYVYNINVCNNGATGSGPVTLTDTLPLSATLSGWWFQYPGWQVLSISAHQLIVQRPSVPGDWCSEIYVQATLDPAAWAGMPLSNTAIITAPNNLEPDNTSTLWHNAGDPHTNLSLYKNWDWGQTVPGGSFTQEFHYRNNSNVPVEHVLITSTIPAGLTYNGAWYFDQFGSHPVTPTLVTAEDVIWDLGTLNAGVHSNIAVEFGLPATTTAGTTFTHTVDILTLPLEDRYDDNQIAWVTTVQPGGPNLHIDVTNYWWDSESQLVFELRVKNYGSTQLDDIWITDTYPVSTTFDAWWINHGPYISATHAAAERALVVYVERLTPGETASLNLQVNLDPPVAGLGGLAFLNSANAPFPGDVYPPDNTSQVTAFTGPDVFVEKWLSGGLPHPGQIVTFTVAFGNANGWPWDGDPNYGSHITDTLPGMTFITATAPWDPSQHWTPELLTGDQVVWGWETLWNQSYWTFDMVVQLDSDLQPGQVITNAIEAYGDSPDDLEADWSNNVFELPITVINPSYTISKTYDSTRIAGAAVTYTLAIANTGNLPGSDLDVVDPLPAAVTYASGGAYDPISGNVSWQIADLAAGASAQVGFSGSLGCSAGAAVSNASYQVAGSAEGIASLPGAAVTFDILAPTIQADLEASALSVAVGEIVTFTATAASDGAALSLSWDFSDGATASGATVEHVFSAPGSYWVTLTAGDACGFEAVAQVQILVTPDQQFIFIPVVKH